METLSRIEWFGVYTCSGRPFLAPFSARTPLLLPTISSVDQLRGIRSLKACTVCALKASTPGSGLEEGGILRTFLKERQLNGDFISKASDAIWQSEALNLAEEEVDVPICSPQQPEEAVKRESEGGFLKLTKTHEWILGLDSAPTNPKAVSKELQDDSEKRKKLNLLRYEALKREMQLISVSIGTVCSVYCLLTLSAQAAVSYAVGVGFSCVYLHLLCQYTDKLCGEDVPQIFKQNKSKKIGIRSEELGAFLERSMKGSGLALSSTRLLIPAAIYGVWIFSHRLIPKDFLDFQVVPAMVGFFAYKAAAVVQVYRDNKDLLLVFPEGTEGLE